MPPQMWKSWHVRLKAMKAGVPDVEIASGVEEILQRDVRDNYTVKRAAVNHWLNGRRIPTLAEFFALCQVIGVDPGEVLFGERVLHRYTPAHSDTARALRQQAAEPIALYDPQSKVREFKAKRRRVRKAVIR